MELFMLDDGCKDLIAKLKSLQNVVPCMKEKGITKIELLRDSFHYILLFEEYLLTEKPQTKKRMLRREYSIIVH